MQNPTTTMDILTRLRVKRVGLSLDDFGTGYSSLTQLYQMPFNEMKIDKSLVMNVPHSREANTMVGSLIELGHNLGLKICAEGVENRAALDMLAIMGCDRCQGYFISRAVPARGHPELRDSMEPRQPGVVVHDPAARGRLTELLEHQRERQPANDNRLMVMDDDPDVGAFFGQVGEDLGFEVEVHLGPDAVRRDRARVLADRDAARPADAGPRRHRALARALARSIAIRRC